jgi:deazaflavin-dependent oxidoreductase (nitroreductase family)
MKGPLQAALRRLTQITRPLALRSAGNARSSNSVVRHVGRRSGTTYQTPVVAVEHEGSFYIALPYGERTDWAKNVLASGTAEISTGARTCAVDGPEIVPRADATRFFGPKEQRLHRWFNVETAMQVHCRNVPSSGNTEGAD